MNLKKRYIFRNIEQEILKIEYILQHTTDFDKEEIIKKSSSLITIHI